MTLVVKKYGGSSLSSVAKLKSIAKNINDLHYGSDQKLIIVLSAMGSSTDKLVYLSRRAVKDVNKRDYDMLLSSGEQVSIAMLSMLINDLGGKAISLKFTATGSETYYLFTKSRSTTNYSTSNVQYPIISIEPTFYAIS